MVEFRNRKDNVLLRQIEKHRRVESVIVGTNDLGPSRLDHIPFVIQCVDLGALSGDKPTVGEQGVSVLWPRSIMIFFIQPFNNDTGSSNIPDMQTQARLAPRRRPRWSAAQHWWCRLFQSSCPVYCSSLHLFGRNENDHVADTPIYTHLLLLPVRVRVC